MSHQSSLQTLSIIIPAYNEAATICIILDKILKVNLIRNIQKEILIVNDCSTDKTKDVVTAYIAKHATERIVLINQSSNQGKGAAIRKGLEEITGDYVIIQDADLEYNPQDYNPLLEHLINENLQVVYGSRFLKKANKHSYHRFYIGGRLVSLVTNILYIQHLTDEPTCYKLFRTDFIKSIPLQCTGFEFCPEITAKVAKRGIKIDEIPIEYYPRSIEEGKKIKWTDGIEAIWTLFKYRFKN
ncbi:MAG: glycosyltransferase family 2 protein [Bacteroidales bacterium]|jgi:glycosyltransferase involved in cell wall biosynthesis|nr:glycosyltransferase family 2 protein [Bacteroidales bacterium]